MKVNKLTVSERRKTLTPTEVESEYGLPKGTLANDRWRKRGIPYFTVRRKILYRREDIERYIFASPVKTIDSLQAEGRS